VYIIEKKGKMLFRPSNIFGLTLNVSLRIVNGRKVADAVKDELVEFVTTFEDEDQLYLSTNTSINYDRRDIVETHGERIAMIGNWRPTEVAPALLVELRKTLHAVTTCGDIDGKWYACLITDRYKQHDENYLSQILTRSSPIWGDATTMVITIGDHYDFKEYESTCNIRGCEFIHLSTPSGIKSVLCEWTKLEK
jgi:hypothetical protein